MISMIACIGQNNELGKKGSLCFRFKEDLAFFKKTTMGKYCIVGKNTYDSLPESKLPGRKLLVLTNDENWTDLHKTNPTIYKIFKNIDLLKIWIKVNIPNEEIFVIGGASIYNQFIDIADKLYITHVNQEDLEADVFFPEIKSKLWTKQSYPSKYENPKYTLLFQVYLRDQCNSKRDLLNKQMIQYIENNNDLNLRFWQMMVNFANEQGYKLILENNQTKEQCDPFYWETINGVDS